MENSKENINWKQIIISSVAPSLVVALVSYALSFFALPNLSFSISESTYFENNYFTTISIESISDKVYRDIEIYITNNTLNGIKAASDINHEGNNIAISEIAPKSTDSFMIISENPITKDAFFVNEDFPINISSSFFEYTLLEMIMIYTVIVCVITFISTIISDKLNRAYARKNKLEWDKALEKVNKENEYISNKILENQDTIDKLNKKHEQLRLDDKIRFQKDKKDMADIKKLGKKMRIFYQIRISDLNKELSFWRNTVRKLLYSKENEFKDADSLIENLYNLRKNKNRY